MEYPVTVRQFIRRFGNLAAFWSAGVLILGLSLLDLAEDLRPEWFCQAINPGGKEFACGVDYSIPAVVFLTRAVVIASIVLYLPGVAALPRKNIRPSGALGLLLSTLLLFTYFAFYFYYWHDDSP